MMGQKRYRCETNEAKKNMWFAFVLEILQTHELYYLLKIHGYWLYGKDLKIMNNSVAQSRLCFLSTSRKPDYVF